MIWKINKDLKVKHTSLRLCDAFLSKTLTLDNNESLGYPTVSLTFPHGTDRARMNNMESQNKHKKELKF